MFVYKFWPTSLPINDVAPSYSTSHIPPTTHVHMLIVCFSFVCLLSLSLNVIQLLYLAAIQAPGCKDVNKLIDWLWNWLIEDTGNLALHSTAWCCHLVNPNTIAICPESSITTAATVFPHYCHDNTHHNITRASPPRTKRDLGFKSEFIWIWTFAGSVPKCCGFILLSAWVISPCIVKNQPATAWEMLINLLFCKGEENEKVIRNAQAGLNQRKG